MQQVPSILSMVMSIHSTRLRGSQEWTDPLALAPTPLYLLLREVISYPDTQWQVTFPPSAHDDLGMCLNRSGVNGITPFYTLEDGPF